MRLRRSREEQAIYAMIHEDIKSRRAAMLHRCWSVGLPSGRDALIDIPIFQPGVRRLSLFSAHNKVA